MFALILFDGNFNLAQHFLIDGTDRRTQLRNRFRGVPVEHAQKILMLKVIFRFQPAAGQERVGNADCGGVSECHAYVEIIIPLQKGTVNDAENILLMGIPVFTCKVGGNIFQLFLNAML